MTLSQTPQDNPLLVSQCQNSIFPVLVSISDFLVRETEGASGQPTPLPHAQGAVQRIEAAILRHCNRCTCVFIAAICTGDPHPYLQGALTGAVDALQTSATATPIDGAWPCELH